VRLKQNTKINPKSCPQQAVTFSFQS